MRAGDHVLTERGREDRRLEGARLARAARFLRADDVHVDVAALARQPPEKPAAAQPFEPARAGGLSERRFA